jgi:hypothetical protein
MALMARISDQEDRAVRLTQVSHGAIRENDSLRATSIRLREDHDRIAAWHFKVRKRLTEALRQRDTYLRDFGRANELVAQQTDTIRGLQARNDTQAKTIDELLAKVREFEVDRPLDLDTVTIRYRNGQFETVFCYPKANFEPK